MLASKGDFESAYGKFKGVLETTGWKESYFTTTYTEAFLNLNVDYLGNFYKG
ncbi:MAG: hypothetical protein LBH24_01160 [Clostridiales bacterium]|nr:hypothetical protein [Clostridiales bacterium]